MFRAKTSSLPNDSARPLFKQIEIFSGILTPYIIDCKYLPLNTRELLGCLLGISPSGQNPCNFIYHDLRLGYQWWHWPFKMATTVYEKVWKATHAWLGGKSCFSHTNPCDFQQLLQSLLLRYTAENLQVTKIEYALSVTANKLFQKRAIFVFQEKWSHDQLLQKAYFSRFLVTVPEVFTKPNSALSLSSSLSGEWESNAF